MLEGSVLKFQDQVAVAMGPVSISYNELWAESTSAAALMLDHGVRPGDRVLLYADNNPAAFVLYLAAARVGAVFIPINPTVEDSILRHGAANGRPALILVLDDGLARDVQRKVPPPAGVPVVHFDLGMRDLDRSRLDAVARLASPRPEAAAVICYSSGHVAAGTKAVTRPHRAEVWNARTYARVWDLRPRDRVLLPVPLSWVYGLSTIGLSALAAGATVVLQPVREPEGLLAAIDRHQITVLAGTVAHYSRLLGELQEHATDHSTLRRLYIGGEPVVPAMVELVEHYTGITPLQAYATSEVAPVLAVHAGVDADPPAGTVGRLVDGAEIRLVSPNGAEVTDGEVGEAWLRGKGAMLRYWDQPHLTAACVTEGGWFRTGDRLRRDDNGYYFMAEHEDDITRGDLTVSITEVEDALAGVLGVSGAVAVGVPDDDFGEALIAFVTTVDSCVSADRIYEDLGRRIARHQLPREIYVLESLPSRLGTRERENLSRLAVHTGQSDNVVVAMSDWLRARVE